MKLSAPLACLAILLVLFFGGSVIYGATSTPATPVFFVLFLVALNWCVAWWILTDCRERRIHTSIDHGWFAFYGWAILLPYHLLKTRGAKGCLVGLVAVVIYTIVYIVLNAYI